jgi:hypothetical protein
MAYDAIFSLLCSGILHSKAANNVQPVAQTTLTQQAMIVGPIPTAVTVPANQAPSFTAALSGIMLGTADGAQLSSTGTVEPADLESVTMDQNGQGMLTGGIEIVVPAQTLAYSNIPQIYLDPSQQVDRVAALVSSNEGKPTTIDWNDNGKGVSVGMFQANQKVGELPDLMHELTLMPGGQEEITSALGPSFAQKMCNDPEAIRHMHFSPKNALGKGLCKLVHSEIFQKLQVEILRRKVVRAAELAANYGITSSAGVAVTADLANQWGFSGARRFLHAADTMRSENGKVRAVVNAVCRYSSYDSRYHCDLEKIEGNNLSYSDTFSATNIASQPYQN